MTYTETLTRHYAEIRSRLMRPEPKERLEFFDVPEEIPMTFLPPPPQQHWRQIVDEVACKHGITARILIGEAGRIRWSPARQEAMYRIRHEMRVAGNAPSYSQIGRWLGGRDHATIMYGVQKHDERSNG